MMMQSTLNMTHKQKRELARARFAHGGSSSTVTTARAAGAASVRRPQRSNTVQSTRVAAQRRSTVTSARAAPRQPQGNTVQPTRGAWLSARRLTPAEKEARRLQAEEWARDLAHRRGLDYDGLEDEASPSPPVVNVAKAAVRPQPQQQRVRVETAVRPQSQRRRRRPQPRRAPTPVVVETVSEDWRVDTTVEWDEPVVMVPVEEEDFWDAAQFVQEPQPKVSPEEKARLEEEVSRAASQRKLDEEPRTAEQHLVHLRRLGRHQTIRLVLTGVAQAALVAGVMAVVGFW